MGFLKHIKRTAEKADKALDSAQEALDNSSKGIQTVIDILSVALIASITANIITIGINIYNARKHRAPGNHIVIHNLFLGGSKHE